MKVAAWLRQRTRHIWRRPRLSFAIVLFLAVWLPALQEINPARALLLAFDAAAAAYLALIYRMMARATVDSLRQRAAEQHEGRWVVLATSLIVALASLVALSLELHSKAGGTPLQVPLAVASIVLVWVFVNTVFTLHYAHDYYRPHAKAVPGLGFPGTDTPDYWDFCYFAFVLGMTFQVSDVQIGNQALRRFALLHSVLAFFFNVVIIALTVNIIAGLG